MGKQKATSSPKKASGSKIASNSVQSVFKKMKNGHLHIKTSDHDDSQDEEYQSNQLAYSSQESPENNDDKQCQLV